MRTITDMEVIELSLVALPAYPATDVSIAQRSLQAWQQQIPARRKSITWLRMRDHPSGATRR